MKNPFFLFISLLKPLEGILPINTMTGDNFLVGYDEAKLILETLIDHELATIGMGFAYRWYLDKDEFQSLVKGC